MGHKKTVHGNQRDYKCKYCPRDFKSPNTKRLHEQVCPNNKQKVYHNCKVCGKTFLQSRCLTSHIRQVHEGRRDYKCESCGKAFYNSGKLKVHIDTVHKGLKPYQCSFCNTAYGQSGDLKRHIKRCHLKEYQILEESKNKEMGL